ncbi:MAG: proline--tRNA ligase, partial [Calditrichaeota bacterium]|nr:proline--tRNA ligase [Calditrichota bacterium]
VVHDEDSKSDVMAYCESLKKEIEDKYYSRRPLVVELDTRDGRGGAKVWDWVKKGIPIRLEVGKREVEENTVFMGRRDLAYKERYAINRSEFLVNLTDTLDEIQRNIYQRANEFRTLNTVKIDNKKDFYDFFTPQNRNQPEIHGGFALAHWNGSEAVEAQIKQDLGVTIRCIPFDEAEEPGRCIITGEESKRRVLFAKAY